MTKGSRIDLSQYEADIGRLYQRGRSQEDIIKWLRHNFSIKISESSLKRWLQKWGLSSNQTKRRAPPATAELVEEIKKLYYSFDYIDDHNIATILNTNQGYKTTANQVKTIRLKNGWVRQFRSSTQTTTAYEEVKKACRYAIIDHGAARGYGRVMLRAFLKEELGIVARLGHIQQALQEIRAEYGISRQLVMKRKRRHEAIFYGPDYCWSIDGHDKFSAFGIEIYGFIDCYSRRILSFYVGPSNRTQVSVLKQYTKLVRHLNRCPKLIRSDRGGEVAMAADAHYSLYCRENECQPPNLPPLRKCYLFGPSPHNHRIERLWWSMLSAQTRPWVNLLNYIQDLGLYDGSHADQVVLQFIFVPFLRREIDIFRRCHNAHKIRKDNIRSRHVSGIPNAIYHNVEGGELVAPFAEQVYGWVPNQARLNEIDSQVAGYDQEIYLQPNAEAWCQQAMQEIGKGPDNPPTVGEFLSQEHGRLAIVPLWYKQLVEKARQYNSQAARLSIVEQPCGGYSWVDERRIKEQIRQERDRVAQEANFRGSDMHTRDELTSCSETDSDEQED